VEEKSFVGEQSQHSTIVNSFKRRRNFFFFFVAETVCNFFFGIQFVAQTNVFSPLLNENKVHIQLFFI